MLYRIYRWGLPIVLVVAVATIFTSQAAATNVTIGADGIVSIELVTSEASYSNTLSVRSPNVGVVMTGCKLQPAGGLGGTQILSEKLSQRGCRVVLDADPGTAGIQPFTAGTTIEFGMCAQTDADPACEYVWSSDPANNSDGFDHVMVTPLYATEYPGRIFRLEWEDLPDGGDLDFNDLIAVVRVDIDSDEDGLWDDWETFGIDTNGDGVVDLDLPALGADPMHKDLFLEIDYMDCSVAGGDCGAGDTHTHQLDQAAINMVVQAFADAPVMNPDGMRGITMHVDQDDAIPHSEIANFAGGTGVTDFDDIKNTYFGATNPRRFAYHYVVSAHKIGTDCWSGVSEINGNDFLVSLGCANGGTVQQQAGTLMHELGHNLNLRHGGDVNTHRKPNYLSVMNYFFQLGGIPPTNRIDYSREVLARLDESSLDEPAGIGNGTDNTKYFDNAASPFVGGAVKSGDGDGPIDWNNDGDTDDIGVTNNVNNDATGDGDPIFGVLTGYDDWANINLAFQATNDFDDGDHASADPEAEFDIDDCVPSLTVEVDRDALWPPNHKLVDIVVTVGLEDLCDPEPTFVLTSVSSNELDNGRGDGNTRNDIQGANIGEPDTHFQLRSERSGLGDGRVYTIIYTATNSLGREVSDTAFVTVPHDRMGMAMSSVGFNADGTKFMPLSGRFALVIPSTPDYDATELDTRTICVGNTKGVIRSVYHTNGDWNADGATDLMLYFSVDAVQQMMQPSVIESDLRMNPKDNPVPVGLRYVTADGTGYLVPDIFALGPPIERQLDVRPFDPTDREQFSRDVVGKTELTSIFPNPCNPSTTIEFNLEESQHVVLKIYDARGVLVRSLADRTFTRGTHRIKWQGKDNSEVLVATGVYFARFTAGQYQTTRRVVFIK